MKKLNWEIIGTMILIAIFWLALIFLLGSCTPIDQDREDRQDSIIALLNTKPDTIVLMKLPAGLLDTVGLIFNGVDSYIEITDSLIGINKVIQSTADSLRREVLINRQYQNAMINSMFVLGKGITTVDSNNRMGYNKLKENQIILKKQLDSIQSFEKQDMDNNVIMKTDCDTAYIIWNIK